MQIYMAVFFSIINKLLISVNTIFKVFICPKSLFFADINIPFRQLN